MPNCSTTYASPRVPEEPNMAQPVQKPLFRPYLPDLGLNANAPRKRSVSNYDIINVPMRKQMCKPQTSKTTYPCDKCGLILKSTTSLSFHLKNTCQIKHCSQCSFSNRFASKLKKHQNSWHNENHTYRCYSCQFAFKDVYLLNKHIKTHGTEVYPCKPCGKNFRSLNSLSRHKRKTHPTSEQVKCLSCHMYYKMLKNHKCSGSQASSQKQHTSVTSIDSHFTCSTASRQRHAAQDLPMPPQYRFMNSQDVFATVSEQVSR